MVGTATIRSLGLSAGQAGPALPSARRPPGNIALLPLDPEAVAISGQLSACWQDMDIDLGIDQLVGIAEIGDRTARLFRSLFCGSGINLFGKHRFCVVTRFSSIGKQNSRVGAKGKPLFTPFEAIFKTPQARTFWRHFNI